jgi:uncharacterized damage-inducible protein DinB
MTNDAVNPRALPTEMNRQPETEDDVLEEFLDFYRDVFARKAEGLSSEQLARTTAASNLTLGGLVKHMAVVEDGWFTARFSGLPEPEPWASAPWDDDPDWELTSAANDSPLELISLYDAACKRSRAVVAAASSLDQLLPSEQAGPRGPTNLRWVMVHMIEEYARHTGHADLLRESIDGQTGD